MKIVIDIPEEDYQNVKAKDKFDDMCLNYYEKLIANGTQLPKGHGRLLDENEIKQMIEDAKVENYRSKDFAENIIKFAPTIIEADDKEDDE